MYLIMNIKRFNSEILVDVKIKSKAVFDKS